MPVTTSSPGARAAEAGWKGKGRAGGLKPAMTGIQGVKAACCPSSVLVWQWFCFIMLVCMGTLSLSRASAVLEVPGCGRVCLVMYAQPSRPVRGAKLCTERWAQAGNVKCWAINTAVPDCAVRCRAGS